MDKNYYKQYYYLEREHWWFTARLSILEKKVSQLLQHKPDANILNIGIATGATSIMLQQYGTVTSLEYDKECCEFVRDKCGLEVINGSMTELPFDNDSYDLVCAFDVVEHIEDDHKAISELRRVMTADGHYFLTVPAFMFLWSEHDEINHHYRRYTKGTFASLLTANNLVSSYSGYFNSLLFIPIAGVRLLQNMLSRKDKVATEKKSDFEGVNSSGLINTILKGIFLLEKPLISLGIPLPFGVSVMAIGHK